MKSKYLVYHQSENNKSQRTESYFTSAANLIDFVRELSLRGISVYGVYEIPSGDDESYPSIIEELKDIGRGLIITTVFGVAVIIYIYLFVWLYNYG